MFCMHNLTLFRSKENHSKFQCMHPIIVSNVIVKLKLFYTTPPTPQKTFKYVI